MRNRRRRQGRHRNRRGQRRENGKVQQEHVALQHRIAQLRQRRTDQHGSQDVGARGRHAETQDDRHDSGDNQRQDRLRVANHQDQVRGLHTQPRHRQAPDHQTRGGTGASHRQDAQRGLAQALDHLPRRQARRLQQRRGDDDTHHADPGGEGRRIAREQRHHDADDRQQEDPARAERLRYGRHLVLGRAQVFAHGAQVDLTKDAEVVEQCGHHGGDDHRLVIHAGIFGENESGRPHHRRHRAAPRRGRDLDRAGEARAVAQSLHHRDGDRARRHHVRGRAARHRAVEP